MLLISSSISRCSSSDESIRTSLLDHPHLFRNGLPAVMLSNFSLRMWGSSFFESNKVFKPGKSVGKGLVCASTILAFKVANLAVIGDCIDFERARLKRIEDLLKTKQ